MATFTAYTPVTFTYAEFKRGVYEPMTLSEFVATGGTNVTVTNVLGLGLTRIRMLLEVPAPADATWTTTSNYTLTGTGSPTVSSVKVAPDRTWIDLVTTSQTAAASYTLAWTGLTGITAGNDTFTAAALGNGSITLASGCLRNTITGNVLPATATVDYYDSQNNSDASNVCLAVIIR